MTLSAFVYLLILSVPCQSMYLEATTGVRTQSEQATMPHPNQEVKTDSQDITTLSTSDLPDATELLTNIRSESPILIIGFILGLAGLISILLALARWGTGTTYLLYFGLCSLLYALRLFAETGSMQVITGISSPVLLYLDAIITYVIPVFFLLFVISIVGKGLRHSLQWVLLLQIGFTIFGIVSDLMQGNPLTQHLGNNLMAILDILVMMVNLFHIALRRLKELLPLRIGLIAFGVFVLVNNLASIDLIPLRTNFEPYGMFFLVTCLGYVAVSRYFSNRDQLLTLHTELSTARRIQASILPRSVPKIPGLTVAARYQPMAQVAGDFYDFYIPDDLHLGILIADVSGHGVPAALIASMVKVAFSAQKTQADDPARLLSGMNQEFAGQFEQEFVTAAYLYLDLEQNRAIFSGAGHPPLYRLRQENTRFETFPGKGLMLGPFQKATYLNTTLDLQPQDRFILYTDGILEARNSEEEFFGEERFQQALLHSVHLSVTGQADVCLKTLHSWTGDRTDDDISLLIVSCDGEEKFSG